MTRTPTTARRSSVPLRALGAVALVAGLAACGDDADAGDDASAAAAPSVEIERSRYAPAELTVASGDEVEFTNLDGFDHTVTSDDDSPVEFDSGSFGQDETFTQQFEEPGTYRYFCEIHPTMRGSIIVE